MKKIIFLFPIILFSCKMEEEKNLELEIENALNELAEQCYYEGQRDALEGDVRIEIGADSVNYKWIKSPWDNGKTPQFDPYVDPLNIDL